MKSSFRIPVVYLFVAILVLGAACQPSQNRAAKAGSVTPLTIGVLLPPNYEDEPTPRAMQNIMDKVAQANHLSLTYQYCVDDGSTVDALLAAKPAAVILFGYSIMNMTAAVEKANRAHIPAYTVGEDSMQGVVAGHFVSDSAQGGTLAAKRLAELMHEKGGVLLLEADAAPKATKTFRDEMVRHPQIQILAETPFNSPPAKAKAAVQAAFARFGSTIKGVFAVNDTGADAAETVELCTNQERKDVVMVGIGGTPNVKDEINQGEDSPWKADVVTSLSKTGTIVLEQVARNLRGEKFPAVTEIPMEIVDASNVDQWIRAHWSGSLDLSDVTAKATK